MSKKLQEAMENYLKLCVLIEPLAKVIEEKKAAILLETKIGDRFDVSATIDKSIIKEIVTEIQKMEGIVASKNLRVMQNVPRIVSPKAVLKKLGEKVLLACAKINIKELCNYVGQDWITNNSTADESQKPYLRWFK
jgi:hypothetical protein